MKYSSFQDFFTRKLLVPIPKGKFEIWPCQGAVCDFGIIKNLDSTKIKGENKIVPIIFGSSSKEIPENYFFINIFLHNYNYHRFHSPINGTVKKIEYIKGKLNFLRPWLYSRKHISEPAFKNERYILVLEDDQTRSWFLTFVGGMGVGKIKLNPLVLIGNKINIGDEIGVFLLGSTCCMAIPTEINGLHYLKKVDAGQNLF
jgi:phosphatidylserine decarboxylase